jgi:hypothetical protein
MIKLLVLASLLSSACLAQPVPSVPQQPSPSSPSTIREGTFEHANQWYNRQRQIEIEGGKRWLREHPEQADPQKDIEKQEQLLREREK